LKPRGLHNSRAREGGEMAETARGFEPPLEFPLNPLSKPAPSASRPPVGGLRCDEQRRVTYIASGCAMLPPDLVRDLIPLQERLASSSPSLRLLARQGAANQILGSFGRRLFVVVYTTQSYTQHTAGGRLILSKNAQFCSKFCRPSPIS